MLRSFNFVLNSTYISPFNVSKIIDKVNSKNVGNVTEKSVNMVNILNRPCNNDVKKIENPKKAAYYFRTAAIEYAPEVWRYDPLGTDHLYTMNVILIEETQSLLNNNSLFKSKLCQPRLHVDNIFKQYSTESNPEMQTINTDIPEETNKKININHDSVLFNAKYHTCFEKQLFNHYAKYKPSHILCNYRIATKSRQDHSLIKFNNLFHKCVWEQNGIIRRYSSKARKEHDEESKADGYYFRMGAMEIAPEEWRYVPVIAVNNNLVFPRFIRTIELTDPSLIHYLKHKIEKGEPYCGIFLKTNLSNDSERANKLEDVHPIGVFTAIYEFLQLGNRTQLVAVGHRRIKIIKQVDLVKPMPIKSSSGSKSKKFENRNVLTVEVQNFVHDKFQFNSQIQDLTRQVLKTIANIVESNTTHQENFQQMLLQNKSLVNKPVYVCDLGASLTNANPVELQKILNEKNVVNRLNIILPLLQKELDLLKLQNKIAHEAEKRAKILTKRDILIGQMDIIRKELGIDKREKEKFGEKFRERIKDKTLPVQVKSVIDEELNKLMYLETGNVEYRKTWNYLDWLTALPWGVVSKENFNIDHAKKILDEKHYGMEDIKTRILEFIAINYLKGFSHGKILCFYGPPGIGKTSIAKSIAEALNRKYFHFSVCGMADVSEIKGHRRSYVGALPGKIIQCLRKSNTENPVVLIDEIDKIGNWLNGNICSALLEVMDPAQNTRFLDYYVDIPVDISKFLFLCTANSAYTIAEPLKDRMEMINMAGYIPDEKLMIVKRHLLPKVMKECGLNQERMILHDVCLDILVKNYCRESGIRNLQRHIEKIVRRVALKVVKENISSVEITADNLCEFVGKPTFIYDRMYNVTPPGVVMGLSCSDFGGSTLFIETAARKPVKVQTGGSLLLTGHLGNIMKESARIALTVARNILSKTDSTNKCLETNDIHLHIPHAAIPKDGPSAGCTITTALLSLARGKSIQPNLAMTGEVSVMGKILPVDGIREKLLAAKRSNINCIILPEENRKDFNDLPKYLTEGIEVYFVKEYEEIEKIVFSDEL